MTTGEKKKPLVLTRWGAVAAGFASVVGASLIGLPPAILSETGSAAVATWLVAMALCVPMIMLFRDTVLLTPGSADPLRDTVRAGLGHAWGNLIPIMFGMVVIVGLPTNAVIAARNLAKGAGADIPGIAIASCVLVVAVIVNLVGGGAGAWLQRAGAITLVAVLMAVMFWSFTHAQQSPVALPQMDTIPAIPAGVILAFWAFVGFENLTFLAGDMADPPRDFAVVALITLALLTVLSIALTLAVAVQIPAGRVNPVTGLVDAARRLPGGPVAGALLATAGFVGVLINAITWVRGVSLILTAAARDHLIPVWIAGPDPLQPRRAIAVMAGGFALVSWALHAAPDLVIAALAAASAVFVVIYLICIAAYVRTGGPRRWRLANLALAPVLLWSLWDAGARSLYAVVVVGVAATVAIRARRRQPAAIG